MVRVNWLQCFYFLKKLEIHFPMMNIFKKYNPAWNSVCIVMSDKDITERHVIAECMFS